MLRSYREHHQHHHPTRENNVKCSTPRKGQNVAPEYDTETPAGFLASRRDWLQVFAVDRPNGNGWDVMLRIDGTYYTDHPAHRAEMVAYFQEWLNNAMKEN